jgi:hypothetical protein
VSCYGWTCSLGKIDLNLRRLLLFKRQFNSVPTLPPKWKLQTKLRWKKPSLKKGSGKVVVDKKEVETCYRNKEQEPVKEEKQVSCCGRKQPKAELQRKLTTQYQNCQGEVRTD